MVFKVAELVATLRLDKGNYDSGLSESMARTADLGRQAEATGGSLGGALAGGLRAAAVVMTGTATTAAVLLKSVLDTGLAYNGLQQTSRAALKTLLGGAEAANAQMDKLDAFAKTSPFSKSVFIQAQQQLIGFGAAADKVIPMLSAVNDAVAAIGGSNDDIAAVSGTLADVIGTGKITGDTLNELGLRGINAADILAKGFKTSSADIRDSITKGTIDSGKALDILVAGMASKYAGAAANVKETIEGARDRVKAATRDIGAALAEPFVSKNGGGRLVQWTNDWADALRAVEKRVPAVVSLLQARFAPQLAGVSVLLGKVKTGIQEFDLSNLSKGLDGLSNNLPAVAAVTGAVLGLTSGALSGIPVIGGLLSTINPLAAALVAVAVASPELRAAIGELVGSFAPLLPAVGELSAAMSGALNSAISAVVPLILSGAEVTGALATALVPLIQLIAAAADGFSDLPVGTQAVIVSLGVMLALKGPITTMFTQIGASVTGLQTKLTAGGLKGALSGILSMFGGPWGIVIGGAVAALSLFAVQQQETKSRVDDFTASLDENTGAITSNTSVIAGKKLNEYAETFKAIRLNVKDASDAVANGGKPYVDMVNKVDTLRQAVMNYNMTQGQGGDVHTKAAGELRRIADLYGINEEAAKNLNVGGLTQLLGGMTGLRSEVTTSSDNWKTLNVATEKANPVTLALSDAIKKVGDTTGNTSDRLRAYQDIIDAMNGKTKSVEQAQRDLSKSSRDLAGFLGEVDANGVKVNASMSIAADGTVQFNDAGDRLSVMLDGLGTRGQTAAIAAADLAKAQGRAGDAAKDADAALAPFRKTLQDLVTQGLLSQTQVDALSKSLFGVPGETSAVITDKDSAAAVKLKVDELARTIEATPDKTVTITEPLSPAIVERLKGLGYVTSTLPDGTVRVYQQGAEEARRLADAVKTSITNLNGSTATVYVIADATQAMSDIARAQNNAKISANQYATGGAYRAAGAVVDYYAQGGLREHPRLTPMSGALASIVPQNSWRVIGDNMKSPELFAPLDGSARSIALMQEGARRMGFNMVPRSSVQYLSDGALFGRATAPAPAPAPEPGRRSGPTYQFTGPVTVTNQAEFESMTRQRASDRNAALGIPAIEREL